MSTTLARRAESIRAIARARNVLKEGDRVAFTSCPGTPRTATFLGWAGNWICSKSRSDIAASSIFKINGSPVSFKDPPWERYDPNTGLDFGDHGTAAHAIEWALEHGDVLEAPDFLEAWRDGCAWEEWPEFYEWLLPWPGHSVQKRGD